MAAISLTRLVAVIDPFSSLKLTGHFILSLYLHISQTIERK
jgi:hypothetical protein